MEVGITMVKKIILKVKDGKVYNEGKVYTAKIDEYVGDIYLGGRLTDCCECFSTIDDGPLYCKECYEEVEWGEGDGSEKLNAKWNINKKTNTVTSCEVIPSKVHRLKVKAIKIGSFAVPPPRSSTPIA